MTIVGRSKIDHPSLGTVGGSTLHAQIENIYTNIGNHLAGRYFAYSSIANSTVTTIEHNFGAQFADYKILLYTGSHPNLVRVSNPSASGWTIAATSGFEKTKIDVTAPSTGGPHTFAIFMTQGRGAEVLDDLDDVVISSTPSDNALLVYDQANSRWIPSSAFTEGVLLPNGTTAQRPTGANGIIRYNTDTSSYEGYSSGAWSSLGGGGTVDRVTQASHGFVIGDILYLSGSTYTKAIATAANTAEVVGMVSRVVDSNTFEMTISGEVTGLTSLTAGEVYFLSPSSAGTMTVTEPTTLGQISLPLGVASSTTSFYVTLKRGNVIGGTNARTQINLLVNTTGNIQDVSAYDAGELTGWIYIDATTDLRFFVRAPFAKTGAGTNWNISPSYMGDTPPAGFSLSITSGGVIQYTMPSTAVIPGYSTGQINYALNAPAVGATFPLSVQGSSVTNATTSAPGVITLKAPTQTSYLSGSGTYTVPSGVLYLKIKMAGGGAGGQGINGAGSAGTNSTFGSSLLIANGAAATPANAAESLATGGGFTINAPAIGWGVTGGDGEGNQFVTSNEYSRGARGGSNPLGGAGVGVVNQAGKAAKANTGGGGGGSGRGLGTAQWTGCGGGAGGYLEATIFSPAASYSYSVGAGGAGGTGGPGGGSGAAGIIIIDEYYY